MKFCWFLLRGGDVGSFMMMFLYTEAWKGESKIVLSAIE